MKKIMKKLSYKLLLFFCYLTILNTGHAQTLTVPGYNACPNQTFNITGTWNNAANVQYSLKTSPTVSPIPSNTGVFPVSFPASPAFITATMTAIGVLNNVITTNTVTFLIQIIPPPPLTFLNQTNYCNNSTAIITAQPGGGNGYSVVGPPGVSTFTSISNIISIPNVLPQPHNGNYTVTTVISGCTYTGVTSIAVAPNALLTISNPTNVCLNNIVCISANLAAPSANVSWSGPAGFGDNTYAPCFTANNINLTGVYTVYMDQIFTGGLPCPRTATTSVNVVSTNPVNATASPNAILCDGANLNLNATGATGAIGYSWTGPAGYSSSTQNPILNNVTPPMAGSYAVTALFTNGVITCTRSANVSINIIATAQPIIFANANVCQGDVVNFSVTTTPAASSYSWIGPGFPSGFNQNPPQPGPSITNAQPNQSGLYYVYAKYQLGSVQCITSKSIQINVVPVNSISVIPPGSVCQPNNANLQASAVGASQYFWLGPNSFNASIANPTIYYPTPTASGIYSVTATFYNGVVYCYNTNTVSLSVFPILNFSLVPRQQACYNTPVSISGPSGATSYTWTSSTGFTSNNQNISFTSIQPSNSGTYSLSISLGPCVTKQLSEIDVLTPIQFSLTPFNRIICKNDTVILTGGATGGSQNYAYRWDPPVYLDSPFGNYQKCVPLGTTIYNFIASDIACPNYTISHPFTVKVNEAPKPDLRLTKTEGCQPLCLFLNSRTKNDAAIITYDFGGNAKFQTDSFTYCLEAPGTYSLKILTKSKSNGCLGIYSLPYPLVVHPNPNSQVAWSPESPTITDEITFDPADKYQASDYTWFFKGNSNVEFDTTNLKYPKVFYKTSGKYPIVLISKTDMGCTNTLVKYIDIRDDYNIFIPNTFTPNGDGINDIFQVKATGVSLIGFNIDILNRWGISVYNSKDITVGWDGNFNGKKAEDGNYVYKIKIVGNNGEGRKEMIGTFTLAK
jgi:gliding motility-associated-like protein